MLKVFEHLWKERFKPLGSAAFEQLPIRIHITGVVRSVVSTRRASAEEVARRLKSSSGTEHDVIGLCGGKFKRCC